MLLFDPSIADTLHNTYIWISQRGIHFTLFDAVRTGHDQPSGLDLLPQASDCNLTCCSYFIHQLIVWSWNICCELWQLKLCIFLAHFGHFYCFYISRLFYWRDYGCIRIQLCNNSVYFSLFTTLKFTVIM